MFKRSHFSHRSTVRAMGPLRLNLKKFVSDTTGALFIQMIIYFVLVIGVAGLALDVGRIYTINTSMQAYVDQVALSAAEELDGRPGAIKRARLAAFGGTYSTDEHQDNPMQKRAPFGDDPENDRIDLHELLFISDLPDDTGYQYFIDDLPALATDVDADAEYVVVIARPKSILTSVLRFTGWGNGRAPGGFATAAVAVAGLEDGGLCENAMFMFCNPNEVNSQPLSALGTVRGRMMSLKNHGKKIGGDATAWSPGDFGTVDLPAAVDPEDGSNPCAPGNGNGNNNDANGNSASGQGCKLAATELDLRQCSDRTVDMDPGQSLALHHGLNMRFGIYSSQTEKFRDNPAFAPDENVIKGYGYNESPPNNKNCQLRDFETPADGYVDSISLPRSTCITNGSCGTTTNALARVSPPLSEEMGTYLENDYWATNHDDHATWDTAVADAAKYDDPFFPGTPLTLDTRYNMYYYETVAGGNNELFDRDGDLIPEGELLKDVGTAGGVNEVGDPDLAENPFPQCTDTAAAMNRRVFIIASINCADPNGDGDTSDSVSGNASGVLVDEYYWAFLSEPVVDTEGEHSEDDIFVELIRPLTAEEDPHILHAYPVLHR